RRRDGRGDRLRLLGRPRPAARLLRAHAPAHERDGRRLRRPGSRRLLRLLRGDAHPALRPDRRLGRRAADGGDGQVRHLHDGRLAPDARGDHRLRPAGAHVRPRRRAGERQPLALPRLHARLRDQGATLAVPRLAAGQLPRGAARGDRRPLRRDREGWPLRDAADRDPEVPRPDELLPDGDPRARGRGSRLRLAPRLPLDGFPRRRRLLLARAVRPDRTRPLRRNGSRLRRCRPPDGRARLGLHLALPHRRRRRAADDDRRVPPARRDGARTAGARDAADDGRRHLARRARLGELRRRVPDPRGRLPARLVVGGDRRRRDRPRRDVHAPAHLRRAPRGARHDGRRRGARRAAGRARAHRAARRRPAPPLRLAGRDQPPLVLREQPRRDGEGTVQVSLHTPHVDWFSLATIFALLAASGVSLLGAVLVPRPLRRTFGASVAGLGFLGGIVAAGWLYVDSRHSHAVVSGAFYRDRWTALAQVILCGVGLATTLLSVEHMPGWGRDADPERRDDHIAEYFALLLASAAGMAFFVGAGNLMTLFLSLEWFSIALYVMCAIDYDYEGALEAGLKYLVVGSFGSAALLFGSALVYGATGTISFHGIAAAIAAHGLTG